MVKRLIVKAPPKMKPTRFRFKNNIRLGFRRGKVVEVVKFS